MKRRKQPQHGGGGGGGKGGGARKRGPEHGNSRHKARADSVEDAARFRWGKVAWLLAGAVLVSLCVYCILPSNLRPSSSQEREERDEMAGEGEETEEEEAGEWRQTGLSCERLMAEARQILSQEPRPHWESALDLLASCALQEPENPKPRWNLAVALIQMERPVEALGFIDEALSMDRNNLDYLKTGGAFFSRMGFHQQALQCLERFLELSLHVNSWEELLASISIQREDEWLFLHEADDNVTQIFEILLHSYLNQKLLIKASYMYKVLIGLQGTDVDPALLVAYSIFSLGLGDLANGIHHLRKYTEIQYVAQGYGRGDQAYEVVSAHSLRLFTAGFDSHIIGIVRNLLVTGQMVWDELVYNCQLEELAERIGFELRVNQEDVRRIFASCVIAQGVIPALLQDGAVVYAENIFGWTPLLHAIALGNTAVVEQLLKYNADPQVRTVLAHTSLHIAAIRGSYTVIPTLIKAGLKPSEVDYINRTALQVACLHRWSARPMAAALQVDLPRDCPTQLKYKAPPKHSFQGGWLGSGVHLPASLTTEQCDFDVIPSSADVQQLIFDYLALQRPVLIRGGGSGKEMKPFTAAMLRNKLEQEYGALTMNEVPVPFAVTFGFPIQPTTIKAYLEKMRELFSQRKDRDYRELEPPTFIFEPIPPNHPLLEKFSVPTILTRNRTHISIADIYFHIGPALSGTPPHFHRSSWSLLLYGETRWYLSPPPLAVYTKLTAWDWWLEEHRETERTASAGTLECLQQPGDILIIPDMWGQASVNLRESIGITTEFVYGSSEFSI